MYLKDGRQTLDPKLDRIPQFDERSRGYPVTAALLADSESLRPRSKAWRLTKRPALDQGAEGACVGFAVTNELLAAPVEVRFGSWSTAQRFARESIYWEAQKIDPWPGGSYPGADPFYEGTSVLAGVKVAKRLGYFDSYRWAFSLRDLVLGIGYEGPALLGMNWYFGMYFPDKNHFIRPAGEFVGGHAIVARGVKLVSKPYPKWLQKDSWARAIFSHPRRWEDVDLDRSYVLLRNSWGDDHGDGGDIKMTLSDLELLLKQQGEAVFFLNRTLPA